MNRLPTSPCSNCKRLTDAATVVDHADAIPKPGDLSVCAYCGVINAYDAALLLVPFPDEDFSLLPLDVRRLLKRVQTAIISRRERASR